MVNAVDYVLQVFGYVAAAGVLGGSLRRACFRRYFFLNLYVMAVCACDALRWVFLRTYGFSSPQFSYAYYLSDAVLAILAYILILKFFDILFRNSPLRVTIRLALFFFFLLLAGMSYIFVSHSVSHFYSRLVMEFQQNMYFAMLVLAALLWVSLAHLQLGDRQLNLLITGVGIHASLLAGVFALASLLPKELYLALAPIVQRSSPLATITMFSLWSYAFLRVPAEVTTPAPEPTLEPLLAQAEAGS